MDFWDLTKVVFRRWYVSVPLLLLTGGASVWVAAFVEPNYEATAYVSLIPPQAPANPEERLRNPYLDLGLGALSQSAATVTKDARFLEDLIDRGLTDNITVEPGYPAPIATIQAIGNSRRQATDTVNAVVQRYKDSVLALQRDANAAENSLIMPQRLDQGDNLEEAGGKVKRAVIAVAGAGLLFTAAVTVGFDAILRRRKKTERVDGVRGARATAPAQASVAAARPSGHHEPPTIGLPGPVVVQKEPSATETSPDRAPDSTIVLPKVPAGSTSGRAKQNKGR